MESYRLDTIAPRLRRRFQEAAIPAQRAVLAAACALAVEESGIEGPLPARALALVREGGVNETVADALEELSERFDEQYLDLYALAKDQMTAAAEALFAKARAADALGYALSEDANDHLESLYEAIQSAVDQDAAIKKIEGLLGDRP